MMEEIQSKGGEVLQRIKLLALLLLLLNSSWSSSQETIKMSIYFEFNSYVLGNKFQSKIDSILATTAIMKVSLEAHADSIGSYAFNHQLSWKRGLEVKKISYT